MAPPRHYAAGHTWRVTRETLLGCFRLPPDSRTAAIALFLLVYSAQSASVQLHSFSALPNRSELLVTDNDETPGMGDFLRTFHQLMATHLGHRHQRTPGPFWCPSGLDVCRIKGRKAILRRMVDILVAPAEADLCERPTDWTGLLSPYESIDGAEITIPRPPELDREGTVLPTKLTFRLERPPEFEHLSRGEFRAELREALQARTAAILAGRTGPVADLDELRDRNILDRPEGPPVRRAQGPNDAETLIRHIEAETPEEQAEAAEELREFRKAYSEARDRWRGGDREVLFPHGTWAMGRLHNARVVGPEP